MKRTTSGKRALIRFVEKTTALDGRTKRNLLLFILGVKPNSFVRLRIEKNLHDKHEFERLLNQNKIRFAVSKPRGIEDVVAVDGNKVVWRFSGTWYGYDIFGSAGDQRLFSVSVGLAKRSKHEESDLLLGKLYGYPRCCVEEFIKEHDQVFVRKKYSYRAFYQRLHDTDFKLPFIAFVPGSIHCPRAVELNKTYEQALRRGSPKFFSAYTKKHTYSLPLIVDTEQDFAGSAHEKDAHEYLLVTEKPIEKQHQLLSWLSDKAYERGTVISAKVTIQYDAPHVQARRVLRKIKNFHHERKFPHP